MPLSIELTDPQTEFFTSKYKFTAFVGGFGSGKSHALFSKMLHEKLSRPKVDLGYFAPTYSLIRDIAHIRLQNMLDKAKIPYKLNKSDNILHIFGYGRILFRTLDNPDRIVGFEIFSAYIDELDTLDHSQAENAWNKVVARIRQVDSQAKNDINRIYVATTPEGFRFVYSRWGKNPSPLYKLIKAPTSSNPHLPEDYIDSLRETYPANLVEAYINGEFVNLTSKQVYPSFNRIKNHTDRIVLSGEELHIGIDFNVRNMNAVTHVLDLEAKQAIALDELTALTDTPEMIEEIKERYWDHKIYVYPDASGESGTSTDASKTDIQLLRNAGFYVRAKKKNPRVKNRIQSMNYMFGNAKNEPRYHINTTLCPEYTEALEKQTYGLDGKPVKDPSNPIDDINDSAGYLIYYNFPVDRPKTQQAHVRSY